MKKVINNRLYNTETATCVGTFDNGYEDNDFKAVTEQLYRKKTGEFFLYGWGGAMTNYAERCGSNSWGSGEAINPLSIEQAKEWAEEHLSGDKYIEIFGEVQE